MYQRVDNGFFHAFMSLQMNFSHSNPNPHLTHRRNQIVKMSPHSLKNSIHSFHPKSLARRKNKSSSSQGNVIIL